MKLFQNTICFKNVNHVNSVFRQKPQRSMHLNKTTNYQFSTLFGFIL